MIKNNPYLQLLIFAVVGTFLSCSKDSISKTEPEQFIFALANGSDGNAVITYRRDTSDGSISYLSTEKTGGLGTAAPLGSQNPIVVTNDGKWLLAVNPASNSVSVLKIDETGAHLNAAFPSGGIRPISVAVYKDLVYVLHSGENGTISGFKLSTSGSLTAIADSKQVFADTATNPAQVSFALNGSLLIVTLKIPNKIFAYPVNSNGSLATPFNITSRGIYPYGFSVSTDGTLYVSEGRSGSMSVYKVASSGINALAGPLPTYQSSACWTGLTPNGKFVYILNANSASITGYKADQPGYPLLNPDGVTAKTGDTPIDIQITSDSRFAYVLGSKDHVINCFKIAESGALEKIADRFMNPPGTTGICIK